MKRRIMAFGATALALTATAMEAPSASAASCWGDWCSGEDPVATARANDARTIAYREDIVGARLELRWSPTCKTAWARWHQYPRGWNMGTVVLELATIQDTGYVQKVNLEGRNAPKDNDTSWSPMVYSPDHGVKAAALVSCGGMSLMDAAFDCATGGRIETAML